MRTKLVALEAVDAASSVSSATSGAVPGVADQVVGGIPGAIAHFSQDQSCGGELVDLLPQLHVTLQRIEIAPPAPSLAGGTASTPAAIVHSPPSTHGQSSRDVFPARLGRNRRDSEDYCRLKPLGRTGLVMMAHERPYVDVFSAAARFLQRLEARRVNTSIWEEQHTKFMLLFRNVWAPGEIGDCLTPVTRKPTGLIK